MFNKGNFFGTEILNLYCRDAKSRFVEMKSSLFSYKLMVDWFEDAQKVKKQFSKPGKNLKALIKFEIMLPQCNNELEVDKMIEDFKAYIVAGGFPDAYVEYMEAKEKIKGA